MSNLITVISLKVHFNEKIQSIILLALFYMLLCLILPPLGVTKADASLINKLLRSNLVTTNNDIEVLRRDPKSPLHSAKTFEELRL